MTPIRQHQHRPFPRQILGVTAFLIIALSSSGCCLFTASTIDATEREERPITRRPDSFSPAVAAYRSPDGERIMIEYTARINEKDVTRWICITRREALRWIEEVGVYPTPSTLSPSASGEMAKIHIPQGRFEEKFVCNKPRWKATKMEKLPLARNVEDLYAHRAIFLRTSQEIVIPLRGANGSDWIFIQTTLSTRKLLSPLGKTLVVPAVVCDVATSPLQGIIIFTVISIWGL